MVILQQLMCFIHRELLAFLTATEHSRAKPAPLAASQLELHAQAVDESRIRPDARPTHTDMLLPTEPGARGMRRC
jgi:hypothetical protein